MSDSKNQQPHRTFRLRGRRCSLEYETTAQDTRLKTRLALVELDYSRVYLRRALLQPRRIRLRVDTLIHECLHLAFPDIREEVVNEVATDITRLLFRELHIQGRNEGQ